MGEAVRKEVNQGRLQVLEGFGGFEPVSYRHGLCSTRLAPPSVWRRILGPQDDTQTNVQRSHRKPRGETARMCPGVPTGGVRGSSKMLDTF